jgi:hypothetical protein
MYESGELQPLIKAAAAQAETSEAPGDH